MLSIVIIKYLCLLNLSYNAGLIILPYIRGTFYRYLWKYTLHKLLIS
ncbi:MAG: hypothetical protein JETT_3751 [Candidatus Jettenia ecosi]|uniref:Uncharacterized protein n=1 Tax=Candidatus Jettenia ecosi TaxID=2494326 RepID=A0A533Q602_9BACT|nr:MAG: hypothetical protein JETT_3751 [Candidatus Jettenia ecosi]